MSLSDDELDRYARHIVLPEVGGVGQARFRAATVAVIGAGGLGAPCLLYLAAAGVGRLLVIDDDRVALSNLQRQVLFETGDVGAPKAATAAGRLRALNPHVVVEPVDARLDAGNARELLAGADVIADGCDNFATRAAVGDAAVALGAPLVTGAIGPFDAQLGVWAGHAPGQACWRCFAGSAADVPGRTCADVGVLGAVAGTAGALMATEVLRLLAGFGADRSGRLLLFDALAMRMREVRVPRDPGCPNHG